MDKKKLFKLWLRQDWKQQDTKMAPGAHSNQHENKMQSQNTLVNTSKANCWIKLTKEKKIKQKEEKSLSSAITLKPDKNSWAVLNPIE